MGNVLLLQEAFARLPDQRLEEGRQLRGEGWGPWGWWERGSGGGVDGWPKREREEIEREDGGKAGHGHCTTAWSKIIPACLNFPPSSHT